MPKPTLRHAALIAAMLCASHALAETATDGVDIIPLYLNQNGDGILRFTDPAGSTDVFTVASGAITDSTERPFEVLGAYTGPLDGPKFAICVQQLLTGQFQVDFGFEVYNTATHEPVLRYWVIYDQSQTEPITAFGQGHAPGECSAKYAR